MSFIQPKGCRGFGLDIGALPPNQNVAFFCLAADSLQSGAEGPPPCCVSSTAACVGGGVATGHGWSRTCAGEVQVVQVSGGNAHSLENHEEGLTHSAFFRPAAALTSHNSRHETTTHVSAILGASDERILSLLLWRP